MKNIKLELVNNRHFAEVKIDESKEIICVENNDYTYDLILHDNSDRILQIERVYENAKRLSTINKYTEKYNITFVK